MNWLDIVILVIIVISVLGGIKNGLIKSVFSLAGIVVGVILAGRFYAPLTRGLPSMPENIARIVAFIIILAVVVAIATVLGVVLTRVVSAALLGWLNRIGGGVFGLVIVAIFCAALLAIWVKFMGINGPLKDSAIAPILLDRFPMILALLPDEFGSVRQFFGGSSLY